MIGSFKDRETRLLFEDGKSRRFGNIAKIALRKLDYLNAARALGDLQSPPGNELEALKGDRKGQHSIRINRQWRICFVWTGSDAEDVEIVDYH